MDKPSASKKYTVYQHFNRREDMLDVVEVLRNNEIFARMSDDGEGLGEWTERTIVGAPLRPKFWIEIPEDQFEKANFMLQEVAEANLKEEDLDTHPFNDYSVEELQEVLVEESDWSPDAVVIARRLLLRRGGDVDLKRLRNAARERLEATYAPRSLNPLIIAAVSLLALGASMVLWVLGAMLAFGWLMYFAFGNRRDPNGNRHLAYDNRARRTAKLGLLLQAFGLFFGVLNFVALRWYPVADIDSWLWWWR